MTAFRVLCALLVLALRCLARNVSTYEFLSRPDIRPPTLNVLAVNRSTVADGYIFLTPKTPERSNFTWSSYIYNNDGGLVWSGHRYNIPAHIMTVFDVCSYRNAPHICLTMFRGPVAGLGHGSFSRILDNTYAQVQTIAPSYSYQGQRLNQDMHEFNLVGNGSSALVTSYATVKMNHTFSHCDGAPSVQFVKTGLFTEVATDGSNRTLFAWNALDHVDIDDTPLCPGDATAFSGKNHSDGFDFFHINSVDKNEDGDYLISSRHTWTIYKIAGHQSPSGIKAGNIIWRLGGPRNSFVMDSQVSNSFNFSYQHHARFTSDGIHFLDNANSEASESNSTRLTPTSNSSSGMVVNINDQNMTATLTQHFLPSEQVLDHSQGSHQSLPNGNHFCGLGSINEIFERTADGAIAFSASMGQRPLASYRAFKRPWTGLPAVSELALFAYAHNTSTSNVYYASWNGATTIQEYRFFTSNSSSGPFVPAATGRTDSSFETRAYAHLFGLYSYVEATNASEDILGRSPIIKTFIPAAELAQNCSSLQCAPYTDYQTAPHAIGPVIQMKYVYNE